MLQSYVQILFEAFFGPINIPLRQKWACLYDKWQSFYTYLTKNELAQNFFVNLFGIKFHDNELSDPRAVTWVETKGESVNRRYSRIRKRLQTPTDLLRRRDCVSESAFSPTYPRFDWHGPPFKASSSLYVPPGLTLKILRSANIGHLFFKYERLEQWVIIFLLGINRLIFITEADRV
jgi:hypothetical protein